MRHLYVLAVFFLCFVLCLVNASHGPFYDEKVDCNGVRDECDPEDENFSTEHLEIIIPGEYPTEYPNEVPIEQDEDATYSKNHAVVLKKHSFV